jgi:putative hemolysin
MDLTAIRDLGVILGILILNGFFSLSEMAIVSSRKERLKALMGDEKKNQRKALVAVERPARYLSTVQIGITLIGILAGAFGGTTLSKPLGQTLNQWGIASPLAEGLSVALVVVGITIFSIVIGELVPKRIALSNPELITLRIIAPLEWVAFLFNPLVIFLSRTSDLLLKLFKIQERGNTSITEEELKIILLEGERAGIVRSDERTMVEGVFYLGDRPVETFMTHRSELRWLDLRATAEEAKDLALQGTANQFFPIVDGNLDNVVGIVSGYDILKTLLANRWTGIKPLMKKPTFVPATMSALKAFDAFKRGEAQYLLVMDEYGGLAGTLFIRDLIEEIVGELSSVNRDGEEVILRQDGTYLLGGMVNIDDVGKLFHISDFFKEHREYHTLAGFILEIAGEIPKTGEIYRWKDFQFEIMDMDGNRIDKVLITPPPKDKGKDSESTAQSCKG